MIPFFDLASQQALIKDKLNAYMIKVLEHGKFINGPEVYELEERLSHYTEAKYCISCGNGTDALQIALMALDIGVDDEVIMPGFSYVSTAEVTSLLGAKPVFLDVDLKSFNMNVDLLEEKITEKTKAIIPVSLFGQPADFDEINSIAQKYGISVIEDAAQSFGSVYKNRKSCNLSKIACTSFFPTKPLGCYGDGGAIFTSDKNLSEKIRQIARHGQRGRYKHEIVGVNSRLDTLQAAILLAKLEILDGEVYVRNQMANLYNKNLCEIKGLFLPSVKKFNSSAWAQYTIICNQRELLKEHLEGLGIPSFVHYPLPLNQQLAFKNKNVDLEVSTKLANQVLSIPLHAYMETTIIEKISEAIHSFFKNK